MTPNRTLVLAASWLLCACALAQPASTGAPRHAGTPHPPAAGRQPAPAAQPDLSAPLPSEAVIRQRLLANLQSMQAEQERYLCRITRIGERTDAHGNLLKTSTRTFDMFYVNGREIDEQVAKNGIPLDASAQKKESERVQKEIARDSNATDLSKQQSEDAHQLDIMLHALRFTSGHRILLNGRTTLVYNLSGNPDFHPKDLNGKFLHHMTGTIQVDEATSELVDVNAHLDHDVKIGGGLVANVHKGFWMHVHQTRQSDGVWINDLTEGQGDARAALFFHPYFRFRQITGACRMTQVTTKTSPAAVAQP
jgi:hypothetical protein